jgi:two-component system, cell cycle response regulator DivK
MTEKARILYVEDTIENRILIRRVLQAEGYTIIEAENARTALNILETDIPDLILMDINMPDIDGYTLTAQLREDAKLDHVPIVALTANVMRGDREKTMAAGCDGYIQKPIDVDSLPLQINRYLTR